MLTENLPAHISEEIRLHALYPEVDDLNASVDRAINSLYYSILDDEGKYIGFCQIYNHNFIEGWLGICITSKPHWNKGYGRRAILSLCNLAKNLDIFNLKLRVLSNNHRAIACYTACGFTEYDRAFLNTVDGRCLEFIMMVKDLT